MHVSMLTAVFFGMEIDVPSRKMDLAVKHWRHASWWWRYEMMVGELLKSHLTTRIVTSSLKSLPQKSAAAL